MKQLIKIVGLAAAAAAFAAPAGAATFTLQSLTPVPPTHAAIVAPCALQQRDAAIAGSPFSEDSLVEDGGNVSGTSTVVIGLSPAGNVTTASLLQSSGSWNQDMAALLSAR